MALTVYHHPNCGTCKKALKWLADQGIDVDLIDIREKTPPQKLLKLAVTEGGYKVNQLFNTSGKVYREQGIKDQLATLNQAEAIRLAASDGMLCKRPVITDGEKVTVGFKEATFEATWG